MSDQLQNQLSKLFPVCKEEYLTTLPVTDPAYAFCDNLTLVKLCPSDVLFPRKIIKNPTDKDVKNFISKRISKYLDERKMENNSTGSLFTELDNIRNDKNVLMTSEDQARFPSSSSQSNPKKKLSFPLDEEQDYDSPDENEQSPGHGISEATSVETLFQYDETEGVDNCTKTPEENSFTKKFPNLPRIRCPKNLFVNILHPLYLNSLYNTNPHAYPRKWEQLKKKDPTAAWNSLNQTVIRYINSNYSEQGIKIDSAETSIDFFNIQDLKQEITETIKKAISDNLQEHHPSKTENSRGPSHVDGLAILMARMNETLRVLTSETVKRTGQEVNIPPQIPQTGPNLGTSYRQEKVEVRSPAPTSFSSYKNLDSDGSGEWIE